MMDKELRQWAVKNDIEKKSNAGFWFCFNNYIQEDPEEFRQVFGYDFDAELLTVEMKSVALFIDTWDETKVYEDISYGFDYVVSYIPIVYKDQKLGIYKMLYTLDGQSFDDFFVLD
ncbi:hypothetical protein [Candidatus Pristimantibacillus sp. PTI5]|uniref:hypothetical protein n=1 Tax=Candidatus Pristimantibacillus sp. PTI5 TaxID=3400422 RepID=UPI003B02497A